MGIRKLPIGIQDFEDLRQNGYLYVDKTAFVYKLVTEGKPYFLSRPRRFGKSLLLSTLEAYFLGKKELFKGLKIYEEEEKSENPWQVYPVLTFSLAAGEFTTPDGLRKALSYCMKKFEEKYELKQKDDWDLPVRFKENLMEATNKTGKKVVVLVDEYDNPLLKNLGVNEEQAEANRTLYKAFFAVLKDQDAYLRFAFFTGVTKFSKVSIFSDLNQLKDVTLNKSFDAICGITQEELESNFKPEIEKMAEENGMTGEECLSELKKMYDGYHFCMNSPDIYNPFSLLRAFDENKFGSYWFSTGTPTFLINRLNEINFSPRNFIETVKISESQINDYRPENPDPIPLLYQSGYLTIKDWNLRQLSYKLGFPNNEVKYGFLDALAPGYLHIEDKPAPFNIDLLDDAVEEGDCEGIRKWFTALFAILPYTAGKETETVIEQNFQNVIYISLLVLGKYVRTEVHQSLGRTDCIIETPEYVYIFEFKRDGSAKEALEQIEAQVYAKPYEADSRKIFKIGVNFSSETKNIAEWEVAEH